MDSFDGNNKVDRDEFIIGLKEIGLNLTKGEIDVKNIFILSLITIAFTSLS
jgi:hypothetical protein